MDLFTECLEPEQRVEWEVVESIYPDYVSLHPTKRLVIFEIPIQLEHPHTLLLPCSASRDLRCDPSSQQAELSSLPPIIFGLRLPPAYPATQPPQMVSVISLHAWLPRHHDLQAHMDKLWQEGEGVLCPWIEFIESGRLLVDLGIIDSTHSLIQLPDLTPNISLKMQEWNSEQKTESFERASYACTVCLTSVKGSYCISLSCTHVFCRECLEEYWRMLIEEGSITRVGCPDPGCLKQQHKATEEEVRKVVTEDEMERWMWLTEKAATEADTTMVHCPRPSCQHPVPGPRGTDGEPEPNGELLRICSKCHFSFCSFCLHGWHGPVSDCHVDDIDALVAEFNALDEGSTERAVLWRHFGRTIQAHLAARAATGITQQRRKPLDILVDRYLAFPEDSPERQALEARHGQTLHNAVKARRRQEKYTKVRAKTALRWDEMWVKLNASRCPVCRVPITKSYGCDHMICSRCQTHFCYRCMGKMPTEDPYSHFRGPKACTVNSQFVEDIDG